jgi:hypothetical protein
VIDTSLKTKDWWRSLAADSAFAKDLFGTEHTYRATSKPAAIADLNTNCF